MSGIWIRSQDKKTLVNVEEIRIMNKDITIYCGSGVLGTYSTEEKALKVLDRIVTFIDLGYIYKIDEFGNEMRSFTIVFQMPADDEVEV